MAVQVINDMPDVAIHRGDPVRTYPREVLVPSVAPARFSGRAVFIGIVIALHAAAAIGLLRMTNREPVRIEAAPIEAALIDEAPADEAPPPDYTPPPMELVYSLPTPQEINIETEQLPAITGTAISTPGPVTAATPPLVDSVEYLRAEAPVYPQESQRKREHGTVLLRVLVDASGRPAQIQIERSSGFSRLDSAARECVEKFLFRPYEVNGIAQPAQVLIPIGFDRRSS
jgi:protein TonB